jgi:hypothetical protein
MNEELRQAAEAAKDPTSYSLLTYGWVIALSAWGGAVRFIRKVRAGDMTLKQAILTIVGEIVISSFAGVLTFYGCEAMNVHQLYTAMLVGIAGHMGGRALDPLEALYRRWVDSKREGDQ